MKIELAQFVCYQPPGNTPKASKRDKTLQKVAGKRLEKTLLTAKVLVFHWVFLVFSLKPPAKQSLLWSFDCFLRSRFELGRCGTLDRKALPFFYAFLRLGFWGLTKLGLLYMFKSSTWPESLPGVVPKTTETRGCETMEWLDPRLQPPPSLGGRYTSKFILKDGVIFDLRGSACLIRDCPECAFPMTGYDLLVTEISPLMLHYDDLSWIAGPPDGRTFDPKVVELCACSGSMGAGVSFVGSQVLACLEINDLAIAHLRRNAHGVVHKGSVLVDSDIKKIHQSVVGQIFSVLCGFPCQPFSPQGMKGGSSDPRSNVFWGCLRSIVLLQSQAALLECVTQAAHDRDIMIGIHQLKSLLDWQDQQTLLELAHQWPMRRRRWWCALFRSVWGSVSIPSWPSITPSPTVQSVLRSWGCWPAHDEQALQLTLNEMMAYGNQEFGSEKRQMTVEDTIPTILHSYGCALDRCPCGCRDRPFAVSSLRAKGLRGVYVCSELHSNMRFFHPKELALLLTVPWSMDWDPQPRSALCLQGQAAAPMQALWMFSHMIQAASKTFTDIHPVEPRAVVECYKQELLRQIHSNFPFVVADPCSQISICYAEEPVTTLSTMSSTSLRRIVEAETSLLGWGTRVTSVGTPPLPWDAALLTNNLDLAHAAKKQKKTQSFEMLMVSTVAGGDCLTSLLPIGAFLFQALREHGLHDVFHLVDEEGRLYGADYKLWGSLRLFALTSNSFPTLRCFPLLQNHGQMEESSTTLRGLSGSSVWTQLGDLLCRAVGPDSQRCLLVPPVALQRGLMDNQDFSLLRGLWHEHVQAIIGIFPAKGHWALLIGSVQIEGIVWEYFDGIRDFLYTEACLLARRITNECGVPFLGCRSTQLIAQEHPHTCGTVALAHVSLLLGLAEGWTPDQVLCWHDHFASCPSSVEDLVCFGPDGLQQKLARFLCEKGVPETLSMDRAEEAIRILSPSPVEKAMAAKNTWQYLKAIASRPGYGFKFLKPDELARYIETRAQQRFGNDLKPRKGGASKDKKPLPPELDPLLLELHPKHFLDEENKEVPQIPFSAVVSQAHGLAICSRQQALPFLGESNSISTCALGLLVTTELESEILQSSSSCSIRFPAAYTATSEQVLVNGTLINLGDKEIRRHRADGPSLEQCAVKTNVVKLQVFRDELELSWSDFTQAPLRVVVNLVESLQVCDTSSCNAVCGKFHPPVDAEVNKMLFEVWARSFGNASGKHCPADQAFSYTAFLRVAESGMDALLRSSCSGIYVEPRRDSPPGVDDRYMVVWLPHWSKQEVIHKLRTSAAGIALARLQNKYGIRTRVADAEELHQRLKPEVPFAKHKGSKVFHLQPLPHGLSRAGLEKLLKSWNWKAVPLQPGRGTTLGGSWNVSSDHDPPANVLTAFKQDVLINLVPPPRET